MSGNINKTQKSFLEMQMSPVFFLWMQSLLIYKGKHETSVDIVGREEKERKIKEILKRFIWTF